MAKCAKIMHNLKFPIWKAHNTMVRKDRSASASVYTPPDERKLGKCVGILNKKKTDKDFKKSLLSTVTTNKKQRQAARN